MIEDKMLLGVGWGFPPSFDIYSKSIEMVHGETDIHQSLHILFTTILGERIMELYYGCDLTPLAFARLDLNLKTFMINNIKEAIARCEPRIRVTDIELETDDEIAGTIGIHVSYVIKVTNTPGKLIYSHSFE